MLCCSKPSLNPKPKRPQPTPRTMNDTYAVVNKSKQLPATTTHHYDNIELGGPKGKPPSSTAAPALPPSSTEVYSTVKPKGRPGARSPAPQCSGLNREPACFLFSLFLYPSLLSLSLLFSSQ